MTNEQLEAYAKSEIEKIASYSVIGIPCVATHYGTKYKTYIIGSLKNEPMEILVDELIEDIKIARSYIPEKELVLVWRKWPKFSGDDQGPSIDISCRLAFEQVLPWKEEIWDGISKPEGMPCKWLKGLNTVFIQENVFEDKHLPWELFEIRDEKKHLIAKCPANEIADDIKDMYIKKKREELYGR